MSRDIAQLHPKLQAIIPRLIADCAALGLPVLVTDGMRTKAEQDALYAKGRTAPGSIVTNVRYPNSMHNWGVAFDFCRNVKGREYDDADDFFFRVASVAKTYGLDWGGDWKNFVDKPHLQLAEYSLDGTTAYLRQTYGTPERFKAAWPISPAFPSGEGGASAPDEVPPAGVPTVCGFSDVPADAWYAEPLEWAVSAGLIAGFDDGTFRPDAPLTRAQLVSILYRYHAWQQGQK